MTLDLVGTGEVADMLGVSRWRAADLAKRRDFPRPAAQVSNRTGAVRRFWRRRDVERWNASADRSVGAPVGNRNNPYGRQGKQPREA